MWHLDCDFTIQMVRILRFEIFKMVVRNSSCGFLSIGRDSFKHVFEISHWSRVRELLTQRMSKMDVNMSSCAVCTICTRTIRVLAFQMEDYLRGLWRDLGGCGGLRFSWRILGNLAFASSSASALMRTIARASCEVEATCYWPTRVRGGGDLVIGQNFPSCRVVGCQTLTSTGQKEFKCSSLHLVNLHWCVHWCPRPWCTKSNSRLGDIYIEVVSSCIAQLPSCPMFWQRFRSLNC